MGSAIPLLGNHPIMNTACIDVAISRRYLYIAAQRINEPTISAD